MRRWPAGAPPEAEHEVISPNPARAVRQRIERTYWALERRLVPGLRAPKLCYEDALREQVRAGIRWLDLGCGRRLLPPWRAAAESEMHGRGPCLVGLDYDLPSLRENKAVRHGVRGGVDRLPFAPDSFELVTANMVMEHVADPLQTFREVARVLRPGGRFLFHTVNATNYQTRLNRLLPDLVRDGLVYLLEGRPPAEVFSTHYRCNDHDTIRTLAREAGMVLERLTFHSASAMTYPIPPVAALELLWIRALERPGREASRSNLIAMLHKPLAGEAGEKIR